MAEQWDEWRGRGASELQREPQVLNGLRSCFEVTCQELKSRHTSKPDGNLWVKSTPKTQRSVLSVTVCHIYACYSNSTAIYCLVLVIDTSLCFVATSADRKLTLREGPSGWYIGEDSWAHLRRLFYLTALIPPLSTNTATWQQRGNREETL